MGFAVIAVINAIFIQETFKVAACDDTLMTMQKERAKKMHSKKMERLFAAADTSHDGAVDEFEFLQVCELPGVRSWLAAQELDASDAHALFSLLVNESGTLTANNLISGGAKLKGSARSIDLALVSRYLRELEAQVTEMQSSLKNVHENTSRTLDACSVQRRQLDVVAAGAAHSPPSCPQSPVLRTL